MRLCIIGWETETLYRHDWLCILCWLCTFDSVLNSASLTLYHHGWLCILRWLCNETLHHSLCNLNETLIVDSVLKLGIVDLVSSRLTVNLVLTLHYWLCIETLYPWLHIVTVAVTWLHIVTVDNVSYVESVLRIWIFNSAMTLKLLTLYRHGWLCVLYWLRTETLSPWICNEILYRWLCIVC